MKWNTAGSGSRIAIPVSGGEASCCVVFILPLTTQLCRDLILRAYPNNYLLSPVIPSLCSRTGLNGA